jgi:hypothetical protein
VVQSAPPPLLVNTRSQWPAIGDRLRWTIELFERLEQRERV